MKIKHNKVICNQEVFSDVAKELGLPINIVRTVFQMHSSFTKETMENNTFDGVRWPFLGVFKSKPKEVQVLNHLKGLTPEQQVIFKQELKEGKYKAKRDAKAQLIKRL